MSVEKFIKENNISKIEDFNKFISDKNNLKKISSVLRRYNSSKSSKNFALLVFSKDQISQKKRNSGKKKEI